VPVEPAELSLSLNRELRDRVQLTTHIRSFLFSGCRNQGAGLGCCSQVLCSYGVSGEGDAFPWRPVRVLRRVRLPSFTQSTDRVAGARRIGVPMWAATSKPRRNPLNEIPGGTGSGIYDIRKVHW
jgi:hypothetical protein